MSKSLVKQVKHRAIEDGITVREFTERALHFSLSSPNGSRLIGDTTGTVTWGDGDAKDLTVARVRELTYTDGE